MTTNPLLIPITLIDLLLSVVLLLPIKDDRGAYKSLPAMTLALIGLNVAIHFYIYNILPRQVSSQAVWEQVVYQLMFVPADVIQGTGQPGLTMISATFLHADWMHLLSNMFFLWFFGRKVEDILGPVKFGLLYLVCAFVSGIGSVIGEVALPVTHGTVPNLGASGAIMGVIGAYLFLYHDERIRTLPMVFGVIPIPWLPRVPAWVFIFYTIIGDALNAWLEQQFQAIGYLYSFVNSFAHLSGVIAGLLCIYLFLPAEVLYYRYRPGDRL